MQITTYSKNIHMSIKDSKELQTLLKKEVYKYMDDKVYSFGNN